MLLLKNAAETLSRAQKQRVIRFPGAGKARDDGCQLAVRVTHAPEFRLRLTDLQMNRERLFLVAVHRQRCVDAHGVLQIRDRFFRPAFRQQAVAVVLARERGRLRRVDVRVFATLLAGCVREQGLQLRQGLLSLTPPKKEARVDRDGIDVVTVRGPERLESQRGGSLQGVQSGVELPGGRLRLPEIDIEWGQLGILGAEPRLQHLNRALI